MRGRNWCVSFALYGLLTGCGVNNGSDSEPPSRSIARLGAAPQVSPDLPLDQDAPPEFNPNASLLSIAASADNGYLLAYRVPYAPESWSRFTSNNLLGSGFSSNELVLMRWAVSGAATPFATLPGLATGATFGSARVLDIGTGWLVVYEVATSGVNRYSVTVAKDGSIGAPVAVPGVCANGLVGFARSSNTALLTDACGAGVLLDFNGQVLKTMTIATPATLDYYPPSLGCTSLGYTDGQVAFDGIDFLALYSCVTNLSKAVFGIPVSPAGDLSSKVTIVPGPQVPYEGVSPLSIAGSNSGGFLVVVSESQSSGPQAAAAYRTISETAAHAFSIGTEHVLPGESILNDGQMSDRGATALALGGAFGIVRERSNGNLDLVTPGPSETDPVTALPLLNALPDAPVALASSSDPYAGGGRLLIGAGARAVRFDASAVAVDVPPAVLFASERGQFAPSIGFDGQTFLAAWTEAIRLVSGFSLSQKAPQILGHRLSASGTLLGATSFEITAMEQVGVKPLVVANPGIFSSAFNNYGYVGGGAATITSADSPSVTPYPPPQPLTAHELGMVTDGSHTTIAWDADFVTIAQLASPGVWSTPLTIAPVVDPEISAPALAFKDEQYAVLWTSQGNPGERVINGARVSAAMALLDSTPKEILRFASPLTDLGRVSDTGIELISAGDQFVVAWADVAGSTESIRIARLSSNLQILDPSGIVVATQPYPTIGATTHRFALGWDEASVWVVWRDGEGGARRPYASLLGRRFSDNLAPIDSAPFSISNDLDEFSKVTLARGPGDSSLVGYTRYLAGAGSFRVRARFLSTTSFADDMPCANASQCRSGSCVAGYCAAVAGGGGGAAGGAGAAGGTESGGSGGSGATAGNDGIGATAGDNGSGGVAGNPNSVGGAAGVGVAGEADVGGSSGRFDDAGAGGELTVGTAGASMVGGGAGTGGNAAESDSCSCRVVGGEPARDRLPPLAALLLAIGTTLYRRRAPRIVGRQEMGV